LRWVRLDSLAAGTAVDGMVADGTAEIEVAGTVEGTDTGTPVIIDGTVDTDGTEAAIPRGG
jgi:hypothetical protein